MTGISRVVLYKHGVGYFERIEEVEGSSEVRLSFRANDMNDVLKSLTLHDLDGGLVSSVSYDTLKPVSTLLEEVALDIPSEGGTAALLAAVRGARVQALVGSRKIEGQVVGVESIQRHFSEGVVESPELTLLGPEGLLQKVDLTELSSLTFLDEHIRKDLAYYFDTLIHSYKRDAKSLSIHTSGTGKRRLQANYIIESPVWKTSYRVLLPAQGSSEEAFLEGWAMVDNVQDEDWTDVKLSLVSGLPISFTHDLYSPRYVQRREVKVERESLAGPVMADEGFAPPPPPAPCMAAPGGGGSFGASTESGMLRAKRSAVRKMAESTVSQSLGDLFEYSIDHPVTVRRNQSALVPIVAKEFDAKRIVFYNRGERAGNPFAAVELKNTTRLTLEGGPSVVFEGETYAGEAMLDTLKPDEKRIVPFAVDLGVSVETDRDDKSEDVTSLVVRDGYARLRSARVSSRSYTFHSKDDRPRTCILEHPIDSNAKLFETPAPDQTTGNSYRFRFELKPRQATTFQVNERSDQEDTLSLRELNRDSLGLFISRRYVNASQEAMLAEIVGLTESLAKLSKKVNESKAKIQEIGEDQTRLRKNLQSLGTSSDQARLRNRYVEKLESQETEIEQLEGRVKKLQQEIESRRAEVDKSMRKVDFESLLTPEAVEAEEPAAEDPGLEEALEDGDKQPVDKPEGLPQEELGLDETAPE